MKTQKIDAFSVIGIAVQTTNENGQAGIDIPLLWSKFMSEGIVEKIPNKIDTALHCMYTDYEKDHTKPYTTILGCKVAHLETIPEGMTGKTIKAGNYIRFAVKGNLQQGAVFKTWQKIWDTPIARTYTADFEVYGEKAQNPESAELDIFIAVK